LKFLSFVSIADNGSPTETAEDTAKHKTAAGNELTVTGRDYFGVVTSGYFGTSGPE